MFSRRVELMVGFIKNEKNGRKSFVIYIFLKKLIINIFFKLFFFLFVKKLLKSWFSCVVEGLKA